MPTRAERRAAEHAARKLANKQSRTQQPQSVAPASVEPPAPESETDLLAKAQAFFSANPPAPISDIQLAANRANAQRSTGPSSPAGKAISSSNARTHGLTGKFVLLPTEDAAEYDHALQACIQTYKPASEEENRLVQSMHNCLWRIDRLQNFEAAVMLKGHIEFAEKFEDRTRSERVLLIQAETYLKYEQSISNLHIQEARLLRTREKDQAELLRLQTIRRREEMLAAMHAPKTPSEPFVARDQSPNGFDFSTDANRSAETDSEGRTTPAAA